MKRIEIIHLAQKKMRQRGISEEMVFETLESPEQIVTGYGGREVRQKIFKVDDTEKLLRVIVEVKSDKIVVITAYLTSKIKKYWRKNED